MTQKAKVQNIKEHQDKCQLKEKYIEEEGEKKQCLKARWGSPQEWRKVGAEKDVSDSQSCVATRTTLSQGQKVTASHRTSRKRESGDSGRWCKRRNTMQLVSVRCKEREVERWPPHEGSY